MSNIKLSKQQLSDLETMIDISGIYQVLKAISEICGAKAGHIAYDWQDASLAKRWDKVARLVEQAAVSQARGL